MDITTTDTAEMLGVTEAEVRRLMREGLLAGRRFGRMWLVDAGDVHRRLQLSAGRGRVWSSRVGAGAVRLLAGSPADGLSRSEASRLRRSLRDCRAGDVVRLARQLASTEHWRVSAGALEQLRSSRRAFVTHVSALDSIATDLPADSDGVLHIGVAVENLEGLRRSVRARDASESANVIVHVFHADLGSQIRNLEVQRVFTSLTLGVHEDARVRAAALRYLDGRLTSLSAWRPRNQSVERSVRPA